MNNNFFENILIYAAELDSHYAGNLKDRQALIMFMEQNGLLDSVGFPREKKYEIIRLNYSWVPSEDEISLVRDRLCLWLSAYKRSHQERLDILCSYGKQILPETCRTYREFIYANTFEHRKVSWELLDYLLSEQYEEVPEMTSSVKESLIASMHTELPQQHMNLFASYLDSLTDKGGNSHITYSVHTIKGTHVVDAYTFEEFSAMAYCLFNEHYWADHHLLEKACCSQHAANLWAFIAFFFVSGLRGTDVARIPRPSLPYEGEEFRQHILQNEIPDPGRFAREIVFRMQYKDTFPSKTSDISAVPDLKLSIPASIEKPFGIILSVAASYLPESTVGKPFLKRETSYRSIRSVFGSPFSAILNRKNFSIRKANKAYLQGIEIITDAGNDAHINGYLVAALARSHKGTLSTLPEATDMYLKDAAFSGLRPEIVLFEMFERGIFGFIPHLLLKACFGDDYQRLNIFSQTDLIGKIGITPLGIESLVSAGSRAMDQANQVVHEIFENQANIPEILSRIASGEAAARQDGYLCALTASDQGCCFPNRRSCITCQYEICTKAALHQLAAEYSRLVSEHKSSGDWRSAEIIRTAILPVIREYFESIRLMYPDADLTPYHHILQGGLDHYDRVISTHR